jgi:hypothetical protein
MGGAISFLLCMLSRPFTFVFSSMYLDSYNCTRIAWHGNMIANSESVGVRKETVVSNVRVLSQHFLQELRIEPGASRMRSRNATA